MLAAKEVRIPARATFSDEPAKQAFSRNISRRKDPDLTAVGMTAKHDVDIREIPKRCEHRGMGRDQNWRRAWRDVRARLADVAAKREWIVESDDPERPVGKHHFMRFVAQDDCSHGTQYRKCSRQVRRSARVVVIAEDGDHRCTALESHE